MGKFFADLKSLENYLQNNLPKVLLAEKEIENVLKKTMREAVAEAVYKKYTPKQYVRRGHSKNGLGDPNVMQFTDAFMEGNNFYMIFENLAKGQDSLKGEYISETIEKGISENWYDPNGAWAQARPFVKETANNININPSHLIDAVKSAFEKAGFEVR